MSEDTCIECGGPAPHKLICAACLPGYGEKLVDDVDPASREPKEDQ